MIGLDQALSPHFTMRELCASDQATRLHIQNVPSDPAIVAALQGVCAHLLEPIRAQFGPIGPDTGLDSGYRCSTLNDAVGGVKASQHRLGQAVDVKLPKLLSVHDLAVWCAAHLAFDQCIMEHTSDVLDAGWVHLSWVAPTVVPPNCTRPGNRKQKLTITTTGTTLSGFVERP